MRQTGLIIIRTFKVSFNSVARSLAFLITFGIVIPLITLGPIGFIFSGGNISNTIFVNYGILIKVSAIALLAIVISKKMHKDLKQGFIKNFFVNNFSKQNYFLGTFLFYSIAILISSFISFLIAVVVWKTEGSLLNETLYVKTIFIGIYFFGVPIISLWIFAFGFYFSFRVGKNPSLQHYLLISCILLFWIWLYLYSSFSELQAICYGLVLIPGFNLFFAIPQHLSLFGITYWWVYLINFAYVLIGLATLVFFSTDKWLMINNTYSKKTF